MVPKVLGHHVEQLKKDITVDTLWSSPRGYWIISRDIFMRFAFSIQRSNFCFDTSEKLEVLKEEATGGFNYQHRCLLFFVFLSNHTACNPSQYNETAPLKENIVD
jgi:hypothetical protein